MTQVAIESPPRHRAVAPAGHSTFRPDIEGLRGIAVLLVVLFHVGFPGLSGGFTGVDVFFVLSGFLITDLLVKETRRTGTISLVQFYARRARRLLPAAVVVLVATLLAGVVVFSPLEQRTFAKSAIATAVYLSNMRYMRQVTDYFAPDTDADPFLHTWSLAVEEQFYLVWPLLVLLGLKGRPTHRRLVGLIVVVCLVSFAGCVWLTEVRKPWAFFGSPLRAWEFGLGGLASLIPAAALRARPAWCRALGWLGVLAIVAAAVTLSGELRFPGPLALLPALGTVAALLAGVGAPGVGVGTWLGVRPLQHLGRLSYSWYLWHWPVLVIALAVAPTLPLGGRLLCAAGALGAAAATYALVENPIRFHRTLVPRPVLSLGVTAALSAVGLALALGAQRYAHRLTSEPRQQAIAAAVKDGPALEDNGCIVGFVGRGLRECAFGDSASSVTVVLFGDSHAAQWFPALERLAEERRWRLVTMVKSGCPAANVPVYDRRVGREHDECATWRRDAVRRIGALRPTAVILTNSVGYVERPGRTDGYSRLSYDEWRTGTRRTFSTLDSLGVRALFLRDSPRPDVDVPICLSRALYHGRPENVCTSERAVAVDAGVFRIERQAAEGLRRVSLIDLSDLLCGPAVCEPMRNGLVAYRDHSHLAATYVRTLAPAMAEHLVPMIEAEAGVRLAAGTVTDGAATDGRAFE